MQQTNPRRYKYTNKSSPLQKSWLTQKDQTIRQKRIKSRRKSEGCYADYIITFLMSDLFSNINVFNQCL